MSCDHMRAEHDSGNNIVSEKSFPNPAALGARRHELRTAKQSADADRARVILATIFGRWQKYGILCDAKMYAKDGYDDDVVAILRNKLRAPGWNADVHYALARQKDDHGNTTSYSITFKPDLTTFKP